MLKIGEDAALEIGGKHLCEQRIQEIPATFLLGFLLVECGARDEFVSNSSHVERTVSHR